MFVPSLSRAWLGKMIILKSEKVRGAGGRKTVLLGYLLAGKDAGLPLQKASEHLLRDGALAAPQVGRLSAVSGYVVEERLPHLCRKGRPVSQRFFHVCPKPVLIKIARFDVRV